MLTKNVEAGYQLAKDRYAEIGVDTDAALRKLAGIKISLHCWQGDDVQGFLFPEQALSGGISVTGNYPGRARNAAELRNDLERALSLIPGKHKVNLHAIYADTDEKVDLDEIEPKHFASWVDWAKANGVGLDFNPTLFSHPKAESGFTLSSADKSIRDFWIEHCKRTRTIAEYFGRELGQVSVNNIWIADGYKDNPIDKLAPRQRLLAALDEVMAQKMDPKLMQDAVESKLFGLGAEAYTVGSHEFYLGYALSRGTLLTFDAGHFHPTEDISDKFSAYLLFGRGILLHVSRPMRWDSDHVVILDDELRRIGQELVRNDLLRKTYIGLDFFDGTINRIAAWVIGARNMQKSLLLALLEPVEHLKKVENAGDFTTRLALTEELKSYPFGAVWDYYCASKGVPVGQSWLNEVKNYENNV